MSDKKAPRPDVAITLRPSEITRLAGWLAQLKPPPELPPIIYDEKAIRDALKVLLPKPEWREECREDIKAAIALVEHRDLFFVPGSKQANKALAQTLAGLKRAQAAKVKLPWAEAWSLETACDIEAGIAICKHLENEQKQTAPRRPRPPSRRQRQAVQTAHFLVITWLVWRRGIHNADSLSRQSAWYKLSAILFGKKVNLLAHMSRYKKDRTYSLANRKRGAK